MKYFLRTKLLMSFFLVIILTGIAAILISVFLIRSWSNRQISEVIQSDLAAARHIYIDKMEKILTVLEFTALRPKTIRDALIVRDKETLLSKLEEVRLKSDMDILSITDEEGRAFVRAHNPGLFGDNVLNDDEIIARVFETGELLYGTSIVPREKLLKEGENLATRAAIDIIPGVEMEGPEKLEETSGMMIIAAVPVRNESGEIIGVLYGGNLLNHDIGLVDTMKKTLFKDEFYKGKDLGTLTIFQKDLCISTDARNDEGTRLIGTRVSSDLYSDIMKSGQQRINRTLFATDWYITGYEPIRDINGKVIGMLSVGILEQKFLDEKNSRMIYFIGVILSGVAIALLVSLVLSKSFLKPLKELVQRSQQLTEKNFDHQFNVDVDDEVDRLKKTFNYMVSSIKERDIEIEEVYKQINEAKRLSTLGQLAAGVAHEINNPLGGIVVYANLLLEDTPPDDPRYSNIEKIIRESNRCKNIVKGLLDFARQSNPKLEKADLNKIITEALNNIHWEAVFKNVHVTEKFGKNLPPVFIDASQIQEVFENIIRNAAEIMDTSGELTITSRVKNGMGNSRILEILFADTGPGIAPEHIDYIFDPFFTTKRKGHGTGLGLAVSYGIIERHGGTITVQNRPGGGAVFTIQLPVVEEK